MADFIADNQPLTIRGVGFILIIGGQYETCQFSR